MTLTQADPTPAPTATARPWWAERLGEVLFGLVAACSVAYLLRVGKGTTFFYDEWSWIQDRRGWAPHDFLASHNGHFVALPVLAYHLLFTTVGLRAYLPYRLLLMAVHVSLCAALYGYSRSRIGPLLGVIPAGLLLVFGVGYQNLLWPFQIAFIGSLALGLAAFLILDRPVSRSRNVVACLCLLAAVCCSGVALPMLAGAAVRIGLRRQWSRWWVIAVPGLVFLAWYLRYGRTTSNPGTLRQLLSYFAHSYPVSVGAVTGHPADQWHAQAIALCLLLLLAVAVRLALSWRRRQLPVDLLSCITVAVLLWGLTAVTRAPYRDYGASRYLYIDGFIILVVLVEVLRGVRLADRWPGRVLGGALVIAAVASMWTSLHELHHGARGLTSADSYVRAELAALEHSRPAAQYHPDRTRMPMLSAGGYLAAARDLGSPALRWAAVPRQPSSIRNRVDHVLLQAGGNLRFEQNPSPGSPLSAGPPKLTLTNASAVVSGNCAVIRSQAGPFTAIFALPPAGAMLTASGLTHILARRFGPFMTGFTNLQATHVAKLSPLPDGSQVPWTIEVGTDRPLTVCG